MPRPCSGGLLGTPLLYWVGGRAPLLAVAACAPLMLVGGCAPLLLVAACAPTCEQSCAKIVRCELTPGYGRDECALDCERQHDRYELEDDTEAERAFAEHRTCLAASTCEELEDGACYDEALYPF